MRVIEKTVYNFNELSDEAKENVLEHFRNSQFYADWIFQEAGDSFEKFADIFNITRYSIDYLETYRNEYRLNFEDDILNLTGQRLATWINNNYSGYLFKRKFLASFDGHKQHKNIKNYTAPHTGKKYCFYFSAIKKENSCVLTGVCYDDDLLKPIYDFLEKPKNLNIEDLINDCIYSLCSSIQDEYRALLSKEAIAEHCDANNYEFDEDGNLI